MVTPATCLKVLKLANLLLKHEEADPQAGWAEAPLMAFENSYSIVAKYWDTPVGVLKPGAYADLIVVDYWAPTPVLREQTSTVTCSSESPEAWLTARWWVGGFSCATVNWLQSTSRR